MTLSRTEFLSGSKKVSCTHCAQTCEVSTKAMSVFCPHCRKRLVIEDYQIKSFRSLRELETCGDIVVEKRGHIRARIKVGNLTVKGKVNGNVTAQGAVRISKTGLLEGDIQASALAIESGAEIRGFIRIEPPAPDSAASAPVKT